MAGLDPEIWTTDTIAQFWDSVSNDEDLLSFYFTKSHAENLVRIAQMAGLTGGKILDYGCGPGFLSEKLVSLGYDVTALEFSEQSVEQANRRSSLVVGNGLWRGCSLAKELPSTLPSGEFDWVFSIETYEHLREEWIEGYFAELYRLLSNNGRLLISTPNDEKLHKQVCYCPTCGERFHRWGHLRKSTVQSFTRVLEDFNFVVDFCEPIDFENFQLRPGFTWRVLRKVVRSAGLEKSKIYSLLYPQRLSDLRAGGTLVAVVRRAS